MGAIPASYFLIWFIPRLVWHAMDTYDGIIVLANTNHPSVGKVVLTCDLEKGQWVSLENIFKFSQSEDKQVDLSGIFILTVPLINFLTDRNTSVRSPAFSDTGNRVVFVLACHLGNE